MLNLVLGNQLFPAWLESSRSDEFLMIESRAMCARYRYHQQKLVLVFSAMRRFAANLRRKGFVVHYVALDSEEEGRGYLAILESQLAKIGVRQFRMAEVADRGFRAMIEGWARSADVRIVPARSDLFLTPSALFPEAFGGSKPFMKTFYEWQRKRLGILVDKKGDPIGGRWSFDSENRKKLPRGYRAPAVSELSQPPDVRAVIELIEREFPDNPGRASEFWLPTDTAEANRWLDQFLESRFEGFGPYEDAIKSGENPEDDFLNHSALSPLMNLGILPPGTVVARTLAYAAKHRTPLASVEGFLRQIVGWREFVKGIDLIFGDRQSKENFFGHRRRLKACWYEGTTGLRPVDEAIRKALRRGYNHHIERLMILGNAMLLSEVAPEEVHRWFMEMYVDSSEWVMGPNVFGMSQFSDGGIFATKPYICGSNYILKMSDYPRGDWCEIWDALYWNFVDRNLDFFKSNPRMGMAGRLLEKMAPGKRSRHRELAEAFRERTTDRSD